MKKYGANSNCLTNRDFISTSKFSNERNNFSPLNESYFPHRLKKKSSQMSSKSITTTVKFEYTITRNNSIKDNLTKNESEIKKITSFSGGNILRTQSRILNCKKDEPLLLIKDYIYRNKVFENLNMDKICGSSYRKLMKDKNNINSDINKNIIISSNNNNAEQINNNDKNDIKENIKVTKEYTINYDNKIYVQNEKELKLKQRKKNNKFKKENKKINPKNKKINQENKYLLSKGDYFSDKNSIINNQNNNKKKQDLIIDKRKENEIMYIPQAKSEIKNKKKLYNEKHQKLKYLIGKKENIPFNIKTKILDIKGNKFNFENRNNSNLFLYNSFNSAKIKYPEENNKSNNYTKLNKKLDLLNELNSPSNKDNINSTKKMNNLNLYNKFTKQLKKDKFTNFNQYLTNRTMNLMSRFGRVENNKCIMPPNDLKNILFKEGAKFFDFC